MTAEPVVRSALTLDEGVSFVSSCALSVSGNAWSFASENAAAIDAHWAEMKKSHPRYFNGVAHLFEAVNIVGDSLEGRLVRTDFKTCLLWRARGFPEAGVLDGFGAGLIRTSDGDIILGRQRHGNLNAGLSYLPSGFIDESDVDAEGRIDIVASALREFAEETGVGSNLLVKDPGFYITRTGPHVSITVPFRLAMSTAEFVDFAGRHIAASPDSELEAVIPVATLADVETLALPAFTQVLLETLLA